MTSIFLPMEHNINNFEDALDFLEMEDDENVKKLDYDRNIQANDK